MTKRIRGVKAKTAKRSTRKKKSVRPALPPQTVPADDQEVVDTPHKFDLGLTSGPAREQEQDIPWGYGQDRVTAMMLDPDRLYVYWEVTDGALERARAGLGSGGRDAWLVTPDAVQHLLVTHC